MQEHFKDHFIAGYVEIGHAEGLMEGRVEGRVEALVSVLLAILAARSFTVLDKVRTLINTCTDPEELERWAARAATAKTIDEVFAT